MLREDGGAVDAYGSARGPKMERVPWNLAFAIVTLSGAFLVQRGHVRSQTPQDGTDMPPFLPLPSAAATALKVVGKVRDLPALVAPGVKLEPMEAQPRLGGGHAEKGHAKGPKLGD
jgi:hypothetical protein